MRPSLVPIVASLAIIAMWEIARPAAVDQCRARRLVADRTIGYWDMRPMRAGTVWQQAHSFLVFRW
jgi:hypothetical protein